jgi:prepilin-type N-terminal cleavage/methylation domain-containing protein
VTRRAFTLIELVVALAVCGVVLTAAAAMFAMSLRAFPRPDDDVAATAADLQDAAARLRDDLASATGAATFGTRDVSFRVADRDADGSPETVRYAWSGVAGEPLSLTVGASGPVAVGPPLSGFSLTPWWRKVTASSASGTVLEAERTLLRLPMDSTMVMALGSNMFALAFVPVVDADATAFQITRCQFSVNGQLLTVGTLRARLYDCDISGLASATPVATSPSLSLSVLGVDATLDLGFTGAPEIAAGRTVTIVVDATISVGRINLLYNNAAVPLSNSKAATKSGTSAWIELPEGGAPCTVWGRQRRPGSTSADEYRLDGVSVVLTPSQRGAWPARFAVACPAGPNP